ncbi:hypothetical protein [Parapedobacter defluvii]|uniref:hypothetical protein n=1 Tax=Parapedobacter defluvii TaxID=2045106 RepID=UPI003340C24F
MNFNRRQFIAANAALGGLLWLNQLPFPAAARTISTDKAALQVSHFPNALYAFVWRNWGLVPLDRMANTVGATSAQLQSIASFMGLGDAPKVTAEQWERSYLTVIRRNWHLLPKSQLQVLMGWDEAQLEFTLKEDDFFYIKLGSLKPACPPVYYNQLSVLDEKTKISFMQLLKASFPEGLPTKQMPYFQFVNELSAPFTDAKGKSTESIQAGFSPRIAYPYFALFGDPLLDPEIDSYPDAYLERLAASGVDSIWMHIVLSKLTPFPWDPSISTHWEHRLTNLKALTERVRKHGIGIYLYLNEPRHQPEAFFEKYPDLRGQGTALCTSHPAVQQYLEDSIALIVERAPQLAGFFSITASENPTHCWSHGQGDKCPRCALLGPEKVISTLNNLYTKGINRGYASAVASGKGDVADGRPKLIIWDWGWQDDWAAGIVPELTTDHTLLMSVSEWELEIERGGVRSKVGEYSISAIGPGPRARRHWEIAKRHGLKTMAKIQANNSWEIGAVPYIPAVYNVAKHIDQLRKEGIAGIMLSWTLGGYPSPNLEVVSLMGSDRNLPADDAIRTVARRRFGSAADAIVGAWRDVSTHFSKFPYHISVVYNAPLQCGPANLLWSEPTDYKATMVGLPYDDVTSWRAIYPPSVFAGLLREIGEAFAEIIRRLDDDCTKLNLTQTEQKAVRLERNIIETISIHYQSIANQVDFIELRDKLPAAESDRARVKRALSEVLSHEIRLARRMAALQTSDSRLGYEASNQYFYTSADLYEKVLNCTELLNKWVAKV